MQKLVLGGKFVNCNMHEKSKILQFFWRGGGQIRAKKLYLTAAKLFTASIPTSRGGAISPLTIM